MQKIMKQSRALLLFLVFMLILAPLSTFAEAFKTEEINYVALGDSLTAGMLSDSSFGVGYVDVIEGALTDAGYEVHVTNTGVAGYTTDEVLAGMGSVEELAHADIITISAGANDVLRGLDISLLLNFDPKYMDPDQVDALVKEVQEAMVQAEVLKQLAMGELQVAGEAVGEATAEVDSVQDAGDDIIHVLTERYEGEPQWPIIEPMLQELEDHFSGAGEAVEAAQSALHEARATMRAEKVEEASQALAQATIELKAAKGLIEDASSFIPEDLAADVQALLTQITKAISAIEDGKETTEDALIAVVQFNEAAAVALEKQITLENVVQALQLLESIPGKIEGVAGNIGQIIGQIKQVNPTAHVYVMGYYNALPYLPADVQENFTVGLLGNLNFAIQGPTEQLGATFIPTFNLFEGKYTEYLPNPDNIHPSEAGYQAIAEAFRGEIEKQYPGVPSVEEPIVREILMDEKVDVHAGDTLIIKNTMTVLQLPTDLPTGTTLIVTKTADEIQAEAEGLQAFGDVLHFAFDFPEGFDSYEGAFKLTMGYEENAPADVNVYYFNEESNAWENKAGAVNKEAGHITLQIDHFSHYGVFAKQAIEEPEKPKETEKPTDKEGPVDVVQPPSSPGENNGSKQTPGKELPKTATHAYNWMAIGILFLLTGATMCIVRRKRKNSLV